MPLNALKNYEVIFSETTTPLQKPNLDRSPSHVRHTTTSSPITPNQTNNISNPLANKNLNTNSASNLGGSVQIQPISHYQQSKSAMVDMLSSQQLKQKTDAPIQRNALSSTTYKKTAASEYFTKGPTDLSKSTEFSKLKYAPLNVKARNQANLTSLALKPATVEGKPVI